MSFTFKEIFQKVATKMDNDFRKRVANIIDGYKNF